MVQAAEQFHRAGERSRDVWERHTHLSEGAGHAGDAVDEQLLETVRGEDGTRASADDGEADVSAQCLGCGIGVHVMLRRMKRADERKEVLTLGVVTPTNANESGSIPCLTEQLDQRAEL